MFSSRLRFAAAIDTEPTSEKMSASLKGMATWVVRPRLWAAQIAREQETKWRPQMVVANTNLSKHSAHKRLSGPPRSTFQV